MHDKFAIRVAVSLFLAALISGCASSRAPKGYLEMPSMTQTEAYGAWITIDYFSGDGEPRFVEHIEGEFITVQDSSVVVLTSAGVSRVPIKQVDLARLETYSSKHGWVLSWTLFGTLSTISHGFGLVLTAPVWIIVGGIATSAQSHLPIEKYPPKTWDHLSMFARFPQGLPAEIDLTSLRPKVLEK